jgi:hypothetical protein
LHCCGAYHADVFLQQDFYFHEPSIEKAELFNHVLGIPIAARKWNLPRQMNAVQMLFEDSWNEPFGAWKFSTNLVQMNNLFLSGH